MDVIGHDYPRMQVVISGGTVQDRSSHGIRNPGLPKVHRSTPSRVEQPIHRKERLSRREAFVGETAPGGKAPMQPENDEQRLADHVDMQETAAQDGGHSSQVPSLTE